MDIVLTSIFLAECVLKIISFGFLFCGSTSYFRNGWNVADFFIAIISILSITVTSSNLSVIKVLRLLKVLRPLRVISKNEGLRISVKSLSIAIPGILNVLIITMIFYVIFGVIGINYLKGKLFYCDTNHLDPSMFNLDTISNKWDCLTIGGIWDRYY